MDLLLIVFGLGVGLLVGLTGVGGGSLMTPLLILVAGVAPVTAVGSDLAYAAVTKTVGGIKHLRQHTVAIRLSLWMAVGSVPAAIGGVYVLEALQRSQGDDFDNLLLTIVAAAILLTGTMTLVRALFLPKLVEQERSGFSLRPWHRVAAIIVGIFVGFILGMTSAGSGALIAMALILIFRLIPTRVVGTDVFHAALLLWAASAAHVVAGNVDYALVGTILIGSIPGVWAGAHLSVRVPLGTLRLGLGIVLLGAGLGLLTKAGADIPAPVLAAVPVALLALIVKQHVKRASRTPAPVPAESR
jgi:uncharacterized membrane protein YfcA